MTKWEYCDLRKTKDFLEIYISHNCKNQKIFVDQSKYLKPNDKQCNPVTSISVKHTSKWLYP